MRLWQLKAIASHEVSEKDIAPWDITAGRHWCFLLGMLYSTWQGKRAELHLSSMYSLLFQCL